MNAIETSRGRAAHPRATMPPLSSLAQSVRRSPAACLLLAIFLLAGCGGSEVSSDINLTEVTLPSGKTLRAETMRRPVDLQRGMMFRNALPEGRAMLFVHEVESKYSYWMFQCIVPLDILWMDRNRRIVEISADTPPCTSTNPDDCPSYGGNYEARYVLELNGGDAANLGLKVGDILQF